MFLFESKGQNAEGLEAIFSNQILPQLNEVMSRSDGIRFRVFEVRNGIYFINVRCLHFNLD